MQRIISLVLLACSLALPVKADELQLKENAPDTYTVKRGDTLWDISGQFLESPWRWPEIWNLNREQIKDPHWIYPGDVIALDKSGVSPRLRLLRDGVEVSNGGAGGRNGTEKYGPRIRAEALEAGAIPSIRASDIEPFLSKPLFIQEGALEKAPAVIASEDNRVIVGKGNIAYIEGLDGSKGRDWQIYRPGRMLRDPENERVVLGYEAVYVGDAYVKRFGNPATADIVRSKFEVNRGDRLINADEEPFVAYVPHAPDKMIKARIVSAYGSVNEVAQNSIITINRGKKDGMEVGHVLAAYRDGIWVNSELEPRKKIKLPDERVGLIFVFRIFENVSYALVLQSTRQFNLGDVVQTP
jgi:LysM domain